MLKNPLSIYDWSALTSKDRETFIVSKACFNLILHTAQKMQFPNKDFFSKCDQIRRKPNLQGIWSHLLKKSLMENFIFCAVTPDCKIANNLVILCE